MPQVVQGTFTTSQAPVSVGQNSDDLVVHSSVTTMRLTITGLDGSNTVKTQKRTSPGGTWVDQTTYNSDQNNVAVTVASGERWQLITITQQPVRDIRYKLSCEN